MKINPVILLLFVFLLGCGNTEKKSDLSNTAQKKAPLGEAIEWSRLQNRNGNTYIPNTDQPYSGWAKKTYDNGQIEFLAEFTDGTVTRVKKWQENGIPQLDIGFTVGKINISNVPVDEVTLSNFLSFKKKEEELLDGNFTFWHGNGQKESTGTYKGMVWTDNSYGDWNLSGYLPAKMDLFTSWYENGQKKVEGNWKKGKEDGLVTEWYRNGQKKVEGNWKEGKEDGLVTEWYRNGQKKVEGNWKEGKENGLVTLWSENGQKSGEYNWKDGIQDGLTTTWYENGQKSGEYNWKDDKLVTATRWKPNGKKCDITALKDGNGTVLVYSNDGKESSRHTFINGKPVE
jgi:antitoxin component YwqK of YwqJK toxin-antitoxin module